jgi:hypothetical protein
MITRRGLSITLATAALARPALAQQRNLPGLPGTQIWSVYDVGSTGYVEASAIADAMGRAFGTRVRLQPSGTSIGRILPLKQKRVSHAWLANELYFAAEGLYEYATPDWGPQDFRVLAGRKNAFSVVATRESGITKPEDMKGKRLAWVPANSSVNIKIEPILAFAGLTLNDVQLVQFPSYAASLRALIEGRADCAGARPRRRGAARAGGEPARHLLGAARPQQRAGLGQSPARGALRRALRRDHRRRHVRAEPGECHGLSLPHDHGECRYAGRRGAGDDEGGSPTPSTCSRTPTPSCRAGR